MHPMSVPASTAVLVAGGGPAGLTAAAELSRHGIECLVVEPRPQVSHRRRGPRPPASRRWSTYAGGASPASSGLQHRSRSPGRNGSPSASHCPAAGSPISTTPSVSPPAGTAGLPSQASKCRSPSSKRSYASTSAPGPQVDLRLGHAVTALAQDEHGVTIRADDGSAYQVRARYVFGCDGAGGAVRDQIGARYVGRSSSCAPTTSSRGAARQFLWPQTPCSIRSQAGLRPRAQAPTATARQR